MSKSIKIFNRDRELVCILDKTVGVGYQLPLNALWKCTFTLSIDDPKNEYCIPFNFVELYDDRRYIGLFRILPRVLKRSNNDFTITYQCEHVLSTLMDDVLFQYHQIGNKGVYTKEVIRYVLDKQTTKRWKLRNCEFNRQFEYKWENENLLGALFSIPKPFDTKYIWKWDTQTNPGEPWIIDLLPLSNEFKADIMYKKNMIDIEKTIDPTNITNRIYCLGYGEGVNQLNIKKVNNNVPFVEDLTSQQEYGLKSTVLADRRFENAESLKSYGLKMLNELKKPYISYRVTCVDMFRLNSNLYEKFIPGDIVRIRDTEDDVIVDLPITDVNKSDMMGRPEQIQINIANKDKDIARSIADLQERSRINEIYAQGATNQMIIPFADNADNDNPAVIKLYIPDTMVRVNKCILNFSFEAFRAYNKGMASGGGDYYSTDTVDGDSIPITKIAFGNTTTTHRPSDVEYDTVSLHTRSTYGGTEEVPDHKHGIQTFRQVSYHDHRVDISGHEHRVDISGHSHRIRVDDHTHDLDFGIYQGETADKATVTINDKEVPNVEPDKDINLVDYLATDDKGKIYRNQWHVIKIKPNSNTRITANIFLQIFTNSRGGGDY